MHDFQIKAAVHMPNCRCPESIHRRIMSLTRCAQVGPSRTNRIDQELTRKNKFRMNAEHEVRTALGIAVFVETSAFNQSQPMKLDSTCILTWLIHTMFIVFVMDAETKNVETKGMSSLNVSACFRYLQRFSHVICSFWLSFKICFNSIFLGLAIPQNAHLFSLYRGSKMCNGQATSTKTGPKSRKRIKMVAKSTNLKDSESLILYSLQISIDYNIL